MQKDNVNSPKHYAAGKVECIDAIEAATVNLSGIEAVCTANALKYLWRWKQKNGKEDLAKARWYIERLLSRQDCSETVKIIEVTPAPVEHTIATFEEAPVIQAGDIVTYKHGAFGGVIGRVLKIENEEGDLAYFFESRLEAGRFMTDTFYRFIVHPATPEEVAKFEAAERASKVYTVEDWLAGKVAVTGASADIEKLRKMCTLTCRKSVPFGESRFYATSGETGWLASEFVTNMPSQDISLFNL